MRARCLHGLLLLALMALTAAMPLLLADVCDDDCPPSCGDCIACGLVADRSALPVLPARLTSVAPLPPSAAPPPSSSPRQLDHVPLSALG